MLRRVLLSLFATSVAMAAPTSASWHVATANDDGHKLLIRYLADLPPWLQRQEFPKLVAITWSLSTPSGMPTREESARTYEFEDILSKAVQDQQVGLLTVVVTGNGIVEWQYYAKDHAQFMTLLNRALKDKPRYPIKIALEADPGWSAYSRFAAAK